MKAVNTMLESEPSGINEGTMKLFKRMRTPPLSLFERYWKKVEPNAPMFDLTQAAYEYFEVDFFGQKNCWGMRHNESRLGHGILRIVDPSTGHIWEGTFKNGTMHGLAIITE